MSDGSSFTYRSPDEPVMAHEATTGDTTQNPKGIRDIDGEKVNEMVENVGRVADGMRLILDMVRLRGIDIGYFPLGKLTIRIGLAPGAVEPKE